MNSFTFKGVTYEVIPNGNHFTVVDEDGFAMVSIKNESDAETALKEHVIIFKGTPSERTVTPEEVENLYKHALDAFDELNVYKEFHEKWGVQL